jgi:hypothetical protein
MRKLWVSGIAALLAASGAAAQETPTERAAARDVVKQIEQLAPSLGVAQTVERLTGPDAGRDAVIARVKQLMNDELLPMRDRKSVV